MAFDDAIKRTAARHDRVCLPDMTCPRGSGGWRQFGPSGHVPCRAAPLSTATTPAEAAPCVSDGAARERAKQVRAREWLGASNGRTAGGYKAVNITSAHPQGMSARAALFANANAAPGIWYMSASRSGCDAFHRRGEILRQSMRRPIR
jgi:hypothetical protein